MDGYLAEVLHEFPNWSARVDRLESRHYEIYDRLSDLRDVLEDDDHDPVAVSMLRYGLQEWMAAFLDHRRGELDLLQAAINTDIGGG
jgi:hypothetical protein